MSKFDVIIGARKRFPPMGRGRKAFPEWIEELVAVAPEFKDFPVFVVKDGMLVFTSPFRAALGGPKPLTYRFRLEQRVLGLPQRLPDGASVEVDLTALRRAKYKTLPSGGVQRQGAFGNVKKYKGPAVSSIIPGAKSRRGGYRVKVEGMAVWGTGKTALVLDVLPSGYEGQRAVMPELIKELAKQAMGAVPLVEMQQVRLQTEFRGRSSGCYLKKLVRFTGSRGTPTAYADVKIIDFFEKNYPGGSWALRKNESVLFMTDAAGILRGFVCPIMKGAEDSFEIMGERPYQRAKPVIARKG